MRSAKVVAIRRLTKRERCALQLGIDTWQLAAMYAIQNSSTVVPQDLKNVALRRHIGRELQLMHLLRVDAWGNSRLTLAGEAFLEYIEIVCRSNKGTGVQRKKNVLKFAAPVRKSLPA